MKKLYYLIIIIIMLFISGIIAFNVIADDTCIESIITQDINNMDSIYKDNIYWECRITMETPFNESDELNIAEITNVFLTNILKGNDIETTVYLFIHNIEKDSTWIEVHNNAWISDDVELNMDSIKIDFKTAFNKAKHSEFTPSKSRYITLRHGFGRYTCNPFYSIGKDNDGHLWVDAITGIVYDKDPASILK